LVTLYSGRSADVDDLPGLYWLSMFRLFLLTIVVAVGKAQSGTSNDDLQRIVSMHRSGNIDGAIRGYREYLKLRPDAYEIRSNLGAALVQSGNYNEAITEYLRALQDAGGNSGIRLNLALAYYKSGQLQKASAELRTLNAAEPDNHQFLLLLSDCYLGLGSNAAVIDLLTPVRLRGQDDLAVDYLLGTALLRDKQPQRAQIMIDKILRNGESAEALMLLATARIVAHDPQGAVADLKQAIALNPKLPGVYSYYGLALLDTADAESAGDAFRHALDDDPNDYVANLQLGILAKEDRQYDHALKYFEHTLHIRPGDFVARHETATVHFAQDKVDQARAELESIIKDAPDFVEAHVTLATAYYRLKRKVDGDRERAIVQKLNAARQNEETRRSTGDPVPAKKL
jgi:tetratricopeptide (TPR) repeat protein